MAGVAQVLASFDESPPPAPRVTAVTPAILRLSDGWVDGARAQLPPMEGVIEALGYSYCSTDDHGTLWSRPGKSVREGHSARVNHNGRLMMFSSSTPLPASERTTYDVADVILAYELGRLPTSNERVEYLRALRPALSSGGGADQAAEAKPALTSVRLDDAFWQSTDWLTNVRAAAWARGLAPSGVLGALLSAYATTTPMGIWLPAVFGGRSPLNMYCCLVGRSGSGKTASMRLAADLLGPVHNPDILLGRSLRSGEGLPRLTMKRKPKARRGEEPLDDTPSYRNAVQIHFDEGGALGAQAMRVGATVIPYLNTAWAGDGMVGGTKASEDGYFPADLVRICCVIGVQFGVAGNLFTGESASMGFPQRLVFFGTTDPDLLERGREALSMEPVRALGLPERHVSEFTRQTRELEVHREVADEVQDWSLAKQAGQPLSDQLDGHMMLLQLRVAGLMALMSDDWAVDPFWWDLASRVCQQSRAIRSQLVASIGDVTIERARALGQQDVIREEIRDDAWLSRRAKRVALHLKGLENGGAMGDVRECLNSPEKKRRSEILAYAIARGWVIHRGDRYFAGGD